MGYFRELPNLQYQSPYSSRLSSSSYITAKNLFRRMKLRDDLQNVFTIFNKYIIKDGDRPDTVAENEYGKSTFDWVLLISAGIINVRDEWPLSSKDLYDFSFNKYGLSLNDVHHFETTEVLPKGKIVSENFTIPKPDTTQETLNPVKGVTNYEYEVTENEKKRTIFILRPEYLQQFLNDIRNEMTYKRSSQYVNDKLIKTENTRNTI